MIRWNLGTIKQLVKMEYLHLSLPIKMAFTQPLTCRVESTIGSARSVQLAGPPRPDLGSVI